MDKKEIFGHLMNAQAALSQSQAVLSSLAVMLYNETAAAGCEHQEMIDLTTFGGPERKRCKKCGYEEVTKSESED